MKLDYVDIFYSHRYDPATPIEETLEALVDIVKQGKALYAGISNWPCAESKKAYEYLQSRHCPCLIHQGRYSILNRTVEQEGTLGATADAGVGFTAYSPLAQGLLTGRYLGGTIPSDSRAAKGKFLKAADITPELLATLTALDDIARQRGQTLSQMSLAWLLADQRISSVIIGASSREQLVENLRATHNTVFSTDELSEIDRLTLK